MLTERLQRILDHAVERHEAAGLSLMVQTDDEAPVFLCAGFADIADSRPVQRDSIFRLYSMSKPVTAAAVMLLMERGVIDLCEPVARYLPGFAGQTVLENGKCVPAERGVTIYDLLNMTAGLSYPGDDPAGQCAARVFVENQAAMDRGEPGLGTVDFANALGRQPLAFQPGREFRYSTCADILGAVVEAADGRAFADLLREEIFTPLGMKDTDFYVPADRRARFVTCYVRKPEGLVPWTGTHLDCGRYERMPAFASGGAGLVSTLDDYLRFARMLRQGGIYEGRRVLSPETVRYMTSPQLTEAQSASLWDSLSGYSYGKLMRIGVRPGEGKTLIRPGEYGWDGWLGTYFANFPRERTTLLIMETTTDTGTLFRSAEDPQCAALPAAGSEAIRCRKQKRAMSAPSAGASLPNGTASVPTAAAGTRSKRPRRSWPPETRLPGIDHRSSEAAPAPRRCPSAASNPEHRSTSPPA